MGYTVRKSLLLSSLIITVLLFRCGGNDSPSNPNNDFDFSLPDLDGKLYSMQDFGGQVLVLNFWATWCPPCLEEVPKLNDLYDRYKGRGVQVIGIALDKDSLHLVKPFVETNKIAYPILVGNQQVLGGLKNFKGVPTTIVFDRKGKIRKRFDGSFNAEQLEESLELLLEDQES
ncbi:MAG: redoxin family protein [candidate division Zixibacteria bacterium]|nr:redoxin family protein [candidate division Zixibacteria bacterium]